MVQTAEVTKTVIHCSLSVDMTKSYVLLFVFAYLLFLIFTGIKEVQFVRSTIMWFETFVTIAPFFLVQMMRMC